MLTRAKCCIKTGKNCALRDLTAIFFHFWNEKRDDCLPLMITHSKRSRKKRNTDERIFTIFIVSIIKRTVRKKSHLLIVFILRMVGARAFND